MAGDAFAYGIGAVISHVFPDVQERPIAFASHTLTATERNYSQIEKEVLSLVYGIRKFHQYLYGRRFALVTDHKPSTAVLGPKNGIPPLAAARLQRWALLLPSYSYDIEFKSTRLNMEMLVGFRDRHIILFNFPIILFPNSFILPYYSFPLFLFLPYYSFPSSRAICSRLNLGCVPTFKYKSI